MIVIRVNHVEDKLIFILHGMGGYFDMFKEKGEMNLNFPILAARAETFSKIAQTIIKKKVYC